MFRSNHAIVISVLLALATTVRGAEVQYEEESFEGPYSYYSQPSMALGEIGNHNATAVHPDTWGRMAFFSGEKPQFIQKRVKTLYRGYLPIIECTVTRDGVRYDLQGFGATLSGKPEDQLIMFVKLSATNETDGSQDATLWASAVYNPRKNVGGYFQNLFNSDRTYAMDDEAAIENGKVLYMFDADDVSAKYSAIGTPYTKSVTAEESFSIPMTAMCLTRYDWNLKPGETRSAVVKVPHNLIDREDELFDRLAKAKYNNYFRRTVGFWEGLLAAGTQFHIPHWKVGQKMSTALIYLLISREKMEDGYVWQYVDRIQYPRPFFRDSIFTTRVYDLFGHPRFSREHIRYLQGTRFGANSCAIHRDVEAALNPPLDDRRDLSKYVQKLWRYTEHFLLTDNRTYAEEILPEVKALVGWIEKVTAEDERGLIPRCTLMDNEFVENGHRSGDNFWAIAALRATRTMARRIDRNELIEQVDRIEKRLHPAILKAVDKVMKDAGYVAGTFDHGTSTRNSGWGEDRDNPLMVWPGGTLPAFHPAVTAGLKRLRSRYQEDISGHYDGVNGATFVYRTLWGMQQHLARGEQELVTKDLYAMLTHTGSTHGGYEVAWAARYGIEGHGWHFARYVSLVRNMMLRERWDGTLHLFSAVPAEWAKVGNRIGVEDLPTYHGPVSVVQTILEDGARIELKPEFRYVPEAYVLHLPYFADVSKVVVDGDPAEIDRDEYQYGAVKLPAGARHVRIFWKTKPEKMAFNYADYLAGFRKTIPPAKIPIRYFPPEDERRELWNTVVNQPWKVIGPFANRNHTGHETVYGPEKEIDFDAQYDGLEGKVKWRDRAWMPVDYIPVRAVRKPWYRGNFQTTERYSAVDFTAVMGNLNATAYAFSNLVSPKKQKVTLSLGSDGPVMVWLGGKQVHAKKEFRGWRGISPDKDLIEVTLQQGHNPILIKTSRAGTPWGFALRIVDADGKRVEGLHFDPTL